MYRSISILLGFLLSGTLLFGQLDLDTFLERDDIKEVRVHPGKDGFDRILEVMVEQPVNHRDPEGASFEQRIYISHVADSLPIVMITAGYSAQRNYTSEITRHLHCNQIMVEHRYFGRSVPRELDWNYLDTWQAATDHHRLIGLFSEFYDGQWITTGISKGGQTVMFHSYYYPEDADLRVPYVAPLNFSLEDERVYSFLEQVGSRKERRKIRKFQELALKHQEACLPEFNQFSQDKSYSYHLVGGNEKAYEYCVLEYSFAYWQWGTTEISEIPRKEASSKEIVKHMNDVAGFDYFSDGGIMNVQPFFYQAMTEMGYYGYDFSAFSKYLKHVENPIFTFTMPKGKWKEFTPELTRDVERYLMEDADKFIYIYGEYDTWSATAFSGPAAASSRIFFKKAGSHRTRINNMPKEQRQQVWDLVDELLGKE